MSARLRGRVVLALSVFATACSGGATPPAVMRDGGATVPSDAAAMYDARSECSTGDCDGGLPPDGGSLPTPVGSLVYGTPWGADGLGNLEIGKEDGRAIAYRFRAAYDGAVESLRVYFIYRAPGYYAGDGGEVLVELQTDDGSAEHLPSGTVLGSVHITDPMATPFRELTWPTPVDLVRGQLYHVVVTNPADDPVGNYVSIDDLYNEAGAPNVQPGASDTDLAVVWKYSGASSWEPNLHHTPIFEVRYESGESQGQSYVDAWPSSAVTISGSVQARETFTVTGASRTVTAVSVRLEHVSGDGDLTVRLTDEAGETIDEGTVPAAAFGTARSWVTLSFPAPITLVSGRSYAVELSAASGVGFEAYPLQEGTTYGFSNPSLFTDGHAEHRTGGAWQAFRDSTAADLQLYFDVAAR